MNETKTTITEFIESIKKELYAIETLQDYFILKTYENLDFNENYHWFASCCKVLEKGVKEGDPGLLYIVAEIKSYSQQYTYFSFDFASSKNMWFSVLTIQQLYLLSASAGFQHAILWCSYCLDEGLHGFEKSPEKSKAFLERFRESKSKPNTIIMNEFRFLKKEIKKIEDWINDAEHVEDLIDPGKSKALIRFLPDPKEELLHRLDQLVEFCICMGVPYKSDVLITDFGGEDDYKHADHIRDIKNDWLKWCLDQGLEMTFD